MRKTTVRTAAMCGLSFLAMQSAALAQVSPSDEPGREAERFTYPRAAAAKPGAIITLPGAVAPAGAAAMPLQIDTVTITGATVFSGDELQRLYAPLIGKRTTIAAIYELAQTITAHYGNAGYVLSRAIVPPQELDPTGATITIQVVEGYVDRVEWPSATGRLPDFFSDYIAKITAERPTNIKTVMRYLLLAGDLPGLDVTSRFQASADNQNASTLIVDIEEKPFDIFAQVDNRGTEPRGPWQFSTSATLNNILGIHESLTLSYSGAVELDELQRFALGYKQVLTSDGLFGFVNGSRSWGEPGTPALEALEFHSNSTGFDIGLGVPVIRERERNLTVSGLLFMSDNEGEMLGAPSSQDRLRGIRVMADFDFVDSLNGTTQGNVTLSQGFEGLGSTENGSPLASRENGRVDFTTLSASLSRLQEFDGGFSALLAATGQYAFTPLLSPEECGYGGREFGRAFDPAEVSGDSCFAVSAELRFSPDLSDGPLTLAQAYAFADYGRVFRLEPSLGTESEQDGASAGIGLRLGTDNLSVDLSAAKPLTGRLEDGWRYFLTATARY
jgi:hemolysin activation/secretion protein